MVFEWYSGSDTTLEVPRRLMELDRRHDELSADERLAELESLSGLEGDPNWRAHIRARIGFEHYLADETEQSRIAFTQALSQFDLAAGNFHDVVADYGHVLYKLLQQSLGTDQDELVIRYGTSILIWFEDLDLGTSALEIVLQALAVSFSRLADRDEQPLLRDLGLACAIRAHHIASDDPGILKCLTYAYYSLGDLPNSRRAFEMFEQVAPSGPGRADRCLVAQRSN